MTPSALPRLLHDQLQPRVDRVVDGDGALLASQDHAAQAAGRRRVPVGRWRQLYRLIQRHQATLAGASGLFDHLRFT